MTTPWGQLPVLEIVGDEADSVLQLRDELATWMEERVIDQWHPGDMPLGWLEACAREGWIHGVWRERRLIASVTLVYDDPFIWGQQLEPAGYVHMLMVARACAGHGLGRSLLDWAESRIQRTGRQLARLDCVRSNAPLCAYYESAGYRVVGYREFSPNHAGRVGKSIPETALLEKALGPGMS